MIVYGNCNILYPVLDEKSSLMLGVPEFRCLIEDNETPIEAYDRIGEEALRKIVPFFSTNKLPDRKWRDAFVADHINGVVNIDFEKAKELFFDEVRRKRKEKFIELGFPYKLNEELESAIISEETRQKLKELRDITDNIEVLKLEDLILPEILQG